MSAQGIRRLEIRLSDPDDVSRLLEHACSAVGDVQMAFLTSRDGIVIASSSAASEIYSEADEQMALRGSALAAATAGIGDNVAYLAAHGRLRSALFESDNGCSGVYPITATLLLVVIGARTVNLGRLTAAAKRIIALLQDPDA